MQVALAWGRSLVREVMMTWPEPLCGRTPSTTPGSALSKATSHRWAVLQPVPQGRSADGRTS